MEYCACHKLIQWFVILTVVATSNGVTVTKAFLLVFYSFHFYIVRKLYQLYYFLFSFFSTALSLKFHSYMHVRIEVVLYCAKVMGAKFFEICPFANTAVILSGSIQRIAASEIRGRFELSNHSRTVSFKHTTRP